MLTYKEFSRLYFRSIMNYIPRSIKHQAILLSEEGYTQPQIAEMLTISTASVSRAKRNFEVHGDIEPGREKSGPKPKLDPFSEDVCSI